ncbi:glycosyltransferase family 4 protein [Patescibacteria group bacterium]|nr:glycosyltransferase family 4 protein [Patescibacteria group bacterium]
MKIALDVSDLCTDRADGTTRFTVELAKRLPALSEKHDWLYLAPCDVAAKVAGRRSTLLPGQGKFTSFASPWPKYWTQTRLPYDLYRYRPEVLFMPIQQLPYLRPGKMKTVAVIHDLAVHLYPDQFRYKDWLLLHIFSAQAVRAADQIIAVSQATADDIARYYGREDNVHVIHHGVDHQQFYVPDKTERGQSFKQLVKAYPSLNEPYLLFVGQIQPRKNIVRLVEAFEQLRAGGSKLNLVIAGGHGWLQQPIIERVKASVASKHILMTGRVPDELLPAFYWGAEVFVLPSLYEGFGMPLLEAMASGCPVVTSEVSSMPEVVGESAVKVDPTSSASIARGISAALARQGELKASGPEHAKQFSWEKTATKTLRVIEELDK